MVQDVGAENGNDGSKLLARRREILRAASGLFRVKGFHGAGMREIAKAVGMTVGNLYYYFKSKQDLLAFCQEDSLLRLGETAARIEETDNAPAQKLWLMIVGHLRCLNEGTPGSLAHMEIEALEEADRDRIVRIRDAYEARLRVFIDQGVESGAFVSTEPKIAMMAILGAVNWTVKWYRPDGGQPLDAIAHTFASQLVRGLLRDGTRLDIPDESVLGDVDHGEKLDACT